MIVGFLVAAFVFSFVIAIIIMAYRGFHLQQAGGYKNAIKLIGFFISAFAASLLAIIVAYFILSIFVF